MRTIAIAISIAALPALAAAQTVEGEAQAEAGGEVVFVDHSEVEVVEEGTVQEEPTYVEHQAEVEAPSAGVQVDLTVPAPPQVSLQVSDERQLMRARLAEYPLGGPIAMLAIGFPVALIFSYAAYIAYQTEDFVCALDCEEEDPNRVATAILGTIAGVGLVLGIIGTIKLISRVGHRSRIRQEFRAGTLTSLDTALIRF